MATQTTRLGLTKPALTELADITVINANMDILDSAYAASTSYAANLLDNSDFRRPINQRGKSSYGQGYSIDRWWSGIPCTLHTDYLSVNNLDNTAGRGFFQQKVPGLTVGQVYTLALGFKDGTVLSGSGRLSTTDRIDTARNANDTNAYISPIDANGVTLVVIAIGAGVAESVIWAALYEGEYTAATLPPYQPKGYAAELAECKRYYQTVKPINTFAIAHGLMYSTTSARVVFDLAPMRIAPTVRIIGSDSGQPYVHNEGKTVARGSGLSFTTNYLPDSNRLEMDITVSGGVSGTHAALASNSAAYFEFSADL